MADNEGQDPTLNDQQATTDGTTDPEQATPIEGTTNAATTSETSAPTNTDMDTSQTDLEQPADSTGDPVVNTESHPEEVIQPTSGEGKDANKTQHKRDDNAAAGGSGDSGQPGASDKKSKSKARLSGAGGGGDGGGGDEGTISGDAIEPAEENDLATAEAGGGGTVSSDSPKKTPTFADFVALEADVEAQTSKTEMDELKSQSSLLASISDQKDKSQLSSTTAMLLFQITILKSLLDARNSGAEVPYLEISLGIVSASLALQIVAGFLILSLYSLQYKIQRLQSGDVSPHQGLADEEIDASKLGFDNPAYSGGVEEGIEMDMGDTTAATTSTSTTAAANGTAATPRNGKAWNEQSNPQCCSFLEPDTTLESVLADSYTSLYMKELAVSMKFVEESSRGNDEAAITRTWKALKSVHRQANLINNRMIKIEEGKTLHRIEVIQKIITYMMFFIAILSVFITGFGLSENTAAGAGATANNSTTGLPLLVP